MRRQHLPAAAAAILCAALAGSVMAQSQGEPTKAGDKTRSDESRQRRIDQQFARDQLPIPNLENEGPCPFVKVLYDASRMTEFTGAQKAASTVAYSGEIEGISAICRYKGSEPITVEMITTFSMGKGPMATGDSKTVKYWIAVTDRNLAVLAKQPLSFVARFPRNEDRVLVYEHTDKITIPRAKADVSGDNFEVLVGFDVTPEQAAFNREGNRFPVDATGRTAQAARTPAGR